MRREKNLKILSNLLKIIIISVSTVHLTKTRSHLNLPKSSFLLRHRDFSPIPKNAHTNQSHSPRSRKTEFHEIRGTLPPSGMSPLYP